MNQILLVENRSGKNNKRSSSPDIKKIVIFFAVAIIVFGIILVIKGISGISKKGDNTADGGSEFSVPQNSSQPEQVQTPDVNRTDEEDPTLDLSILGNKIKVVAKDDVAIAYVEYTWNNGEQQIIEVNDENKASLESYIDILPGKNTLWVNVVDASGKSKDRTLEIKGRVLPEIEMFITSDGTGIIIKATCTDGLDHVVWRVDDGDGAQISFTGEFEGISKEQWETVGVIIEKSDDGKVTSVEYTYSLPENARTVSIYAYSLEGEVESKQGNIQ